MVNKLDHISTLSYEEIMEIMCALDETSIVTITDKDGAIIYANRKFCEISKYSENELLGQNHRILKSGFHPPEFYQHMWNIISQGKVWKGNVKNKAKDDSFYWVKTTIFPVMGNVKPKEYISIRTDITEQIKMVESLQKLSRQKDEFLAMITHELKTPLVPIISYTDLLLDPRFGILSEKQQSSLNNIRINSKSLLRSISDLLDLQKMELGSFKFEKNNFIISDILLECLLQIKPEFNNKNIELVQNIETGLYCHCDAGRIKQTILNLLINAIDFCPKLTGKIIVTLKREANNARIIIRDNGKGMTDSQISNIFTKFYQVDSSITREHGGTGLGLSICKAIISGHDGQIIAKSEGLGKGTDIHITLPIIDTANATTISN
ncbi:MAG TPA: ATP-binding protein [Nitrosarchaeum sp.]